MGNAELQRKHAYQARLDFMKNNAPAFSNLSQRNHFSIVIGESRTGKDTFIYNLDKSLLSITQGGLHVLRFGDTSSSSTKEPTSINYQNSVILKGYRSGTILNTRGLVDDINTEQKEKNENSIVTMIKLIEHLKNSFQQSNGYIDAVYVICDLSNQVNVDHTNKVLLILQDLFGPDIFSTIIMVLNRLVENIFSKLIMYGEAEKAHRNLAEKYGIQNVVVMKGIYFLKGIKSNPRSDYSEQERNEYIEELKNAVQIVQPYNTCSVATYYNITRSEVAEVRQRIQSSGMSGALLEYTANLQVVLDKLVEKKNKLEQLRSKK